MRACPKCGERYPDGAQFCPLDGTALGPPVEDACQGPRPDPRIGSLIERYRILELLGTGGMGAVYRAEHTLIGRPVALKLLHPDLARDPSVVDRFFREARAANEIASEHIVQVTDFGTTAEGAYLVMELLSGESLLDLLGRTPGNRLRPVPAVQIALQVTEALRAAHARHIIHRDLKPANIVLITRDGRPDFVKILDFGIAKLAEPGSTQLTKTGTIVGSPAYMSPEQATGKQIDHRTDIYALGVILFELLTGRPPFVGETATAILVAHLTTAPPDPRSLCPDVPEALRDIVLRCLAKSPADRPQSMAELGGLLAAWLQAQEAGRQAAAVLPTMAAQGPLPAGAAPAAALAAGVAATQAGAPALMATAPGLAPVAPAPVHIPATLADPLLAGTASAAAAPASVITGPGSPPPATGFGTPVPAKRRTLGTGHLIAIGSAALGVAAGVVVTVLILKSSSSRPPTSPPGIVGASGNAGLPPTAPAGPVPEPGPAPGTGAEQPPASRTARQAEPEQAASPAPRKSTEKTTARSKTATRKSPSRQAGKVAARPSLPANAVAAPKVARQPKAAPQPKVVAAPPPAPPRAARNRYELDQQYREGKINSSQYSFQAEVLRRQMRTELEGVHNLYRNRQISWREKRTRLRLIRARYGF